MKKNLKIGVFIPEFPGQTHSFFWREIKALEHHHGYETHIISTRAPPQRVDHEWVSQAQADYLYPLTPPAFITALLSLLVWLPRLILQPDVRALLGTPKTWALLLMAARLAGLCKHEAIGHLHVHSCANAALIAALCNRMTDLPYSLVLHGPIEDYGPHQPFKWRRADFVFVITEKLRAEMAEVLPEAAKKMYVVPMGVDTDRFAPTKPRPEPEAAFAWFSCARLNRIKGFEILLEALGLLLRDHPTRDWHVSIAGEDESGGNGYRKVLEAAIAAQGLSSRVTLLGAITQSEVLAQLQACHGFVLASFHEPLGVAYMEAMSCGVPTIGTDAGGVKELIIDGTDGLLVPALKAQDLSEAMLRIMTDAPLRAQLSSQGRQRIVSKFGARRSADALANLLDPKC